ncbi:uncharacterized protein [Nicotiana tomentosiformis]|uniref:uncharacterized protein n=1 Tax=Nicotiana tomentosiformis TaxID=4098 RepID=UPI00388CE3F3
MSNLSKLEFVALDISRKNYLSWVLDAEIHLAVKGLGDIITQGNEASSKDKTKAMIFIRHHLDEGLKVEYLTMKDPLELWTSPKERYDHLKVMNNYHDHMNVRGNNNGKQRYNNCHRGGHGKRENNMSSQNNPSRGKSGNCHCCGMKGHWKIECRASENFVRLYENSIKRKSNNVGASYANAPVEFHLTFKNNFEAGPSNKNDDNAESNLALNDDDFEGLDDLTHLEVEDFFGDQN